MSEILRLTVGKPETIALAFTAPREIQSSVTNQVEAMFSLQDGRRIFLPLHVAEQIKDAGIAKGEVFELLKTKSDYRIRTANTAAALGARADEGESSARGGTVQLANGTTHNSSDLTPAKTTPLTTPAATRLMASLCIAIDAAAQAQAYAQRCGLAIVFSEESVRALAITAFIQGGK